MSTDYYGDDGYPYQDHDDGHHGRGSAAKPYPEQDGARGTELVADAAIEGELLSPAENARIERRSAIARRLPAVRATTAVARRVADPPEGVRAAGRAGVRQVRYVAAGTALVADRWRDAHGQSRFERQMRAAEATGDFERLADWQARAERAKQDRHERHQAWIAHPLQLAKLVAGGCAALLVALTGLGLVLAGAYQDIAAFTDPFTAMFTLVRWFATLVAVLWAPVFIAAPLVALGWVWHAGRAATGPAPTRTSATDVVGQPRDVVPDEGAILQALRNLNLAPLTRKFKEGWLPRWPQGTGRDGKGYRTQLELPPGVTVEMINDRKDVLAHNLVRLPVEVWPTEPKRQPGVLDLWVADQGLLTGSVDPYPLLEQGSTDYFAGVPVGIDQRGLEVTGRCMGCNYAVAGIMGSGKTSFVLCLLCGAMLDPLVELDVYVLAYNADYDPLAPRLRTLVKGDEDEHITAGMDALRALRGEVTERGKMLSDLGGDETKLTRAIAEAHPQMRPTVAVFDECQELFRHERYGEEAKQLAIKVMTKARKTGITLAWVTPAPSADSLPRDLAKTVSHRVCYAIGDHQGNDAILGTGAHKQGITATTLAPGEDVGTAMASGFAARPGLLRTHHLRKNASTDDISPIVTRALALREQAGITTDPRPVVEPAEEVDPLADIAAVIGDAPRMRTQEVLQRLAERNRAAYGEWTFADLTDYLQPYGAEPYKYDGRKYVHTARLREAITHRDHERTTAELDEPPNCREQARETGSSPYPGPDPTSPN